MKVLALGFLIVLAVSGQDNGSPPPGCWLPRFAFRDSRF